MAVAPEELAYQASDTPAAMPDDSLAESGGSWAPPGSDSATAKPPSMPDFARWQPWSVADDAKNQQAADEWAQGANQNLADAWGKIAQQQGADTLTQAIQDAQAQLASPPQNQAETPAASDSGQPSTPQDGPAPSPAPDVMRQFFDGLGGLVDRMKGAAGNAASDVRTALGAGDENAAANPAPQLVQQAPAAAWSAATDPLSTAVSAVNALNAASGNGQPAAPTPEQAAEPTTVPASQTATTDIAGQAWPGPGDTAAPLLTPQQATAAQVMGGVVAGGPEGLAAPVAAGTDLARAGISAAAPLVGEGIGRLASAVEASPRVPNFVANAVTDARTALDRLPPAELASSGPGAAQAGDGIPLNTQQVAAAASDAFDMSHPLVQHVAQNLGDDLAQKAVDVLNDPNRMQRILKAPARIASEADQAAYQIYRGSKDAALMQAATEGGDTSAATVQAAVAHNPDPALSQRIAEAQGGPTGAPAQTGSAAPSGTAAKPTFRLGPEGLRPVLPEQAALLPSVAELPAAAADAVVRDAARTALGVPPSDIAAADRGAGATGLVGTAAPTPSGPPAPPVPPAAATAAGAAPMPPAPGAAVSVGQYAKNSIPGLITGSASAGTVWTQDQDDALWRRVLLTALAFKAGSAVPYALQSAAAGPRVGMGSRLFQGFANNVLGPNVAGLKGLTDITSTVTDPAFNFVRSLVRGNGLQAAGSEMGGYYRSLLSGNGVRDGIQAAADALNPAIAATGKGGQASAGVAGLSELASTNNLRTINALAKFWEPIMAQAEQAGMNMTAGATKGVQHTFPGMVGPQALERAHSGMMMGEPEGVVGRILMPIFQGIQRMGGPGRFIEPFANIPANLIDRGVSSTPLVGLLNGIGAKAPDAVIARNVLGTTGALLLRGMFQTTGAGPDDPAQRSAWLKAGNEPYSVKLPWTNTWVPINKIPILPLRGALTFDAALNDVKLNGAPSDMAAQAAKSYGKALSSDVFLPSLIQMAMAVQKGDLSGVPSTVASTVRMLLPMEARLMAKSEETVKPDVSGKPYRPAAATVPDKIGSAVDAQVRANMPRGTGTAAPMPALTNTGQTEENVQRGPSVIAPIAPSRPTADPVQEAYGAAGIAVPAPPTKLAVDGRDVQLTGAQTQHFNELRGAFLAAHLPANPTPTNLQTLLTEAHNAAEQDFRRSNPEAIKAAPTSRQAQQQAQQQRASAWGALGESHPVAPSISPAPSAGAAPQAAGWGALRGVK